MDTTETYIKMSDHPKIQGRWKLKNGDWTVFSITRAISIKHIDEDDKYYLPKKIKTIKKYNIWLPRQDEIQKMLDIENVDDFYNAIFDMFFKSDNDAHYNALPTWKVVDYDSGERFSTPEQLWLAYYMHEKHGLIWDGDKWKQGQ